VPPPPIGEEGASSSDFNPHTMGILRGLPTDSLSWAVVEQCQVTNHSIDSDTTVQQFSCYLNHHDTDFNYSFFYDNGSDYERKATILDLEVRKMNAGELFDQFPPWITANSTSINEEQYSNTSSILVSFILSEETTGFELSDLQTTNCTVTDFSGSGSNYTANITTDSEGQCSIIIDAGAFTDAAGNANLPSELIWTHDVTAPTMTIEADEVSDGDTSLDASLGLTFTASENTVEFAAADITVTNGNISNFTGSGSTYTAILYPSNVGACTINVSASTFADAAGNDNTAADEFNWTYDTAPTMLILAVDDGSFLADGDTSSNATLSLTFQASENTDDFAESDISVTYGAISDFAGSGSTYTAKFTPTGDGGKNISVPAGTFTDAAGYANLASNEINYIYDSTAPTMVITADEVSDGDTSLDATLSLTFTASENTDDFAAADITVTNGAISDFTGSGSTYTATFTPTGDGACTINVPASTFTDAAGNDNTAADEFNWTHTVVVN
jgi:large repetitive protein